ncbi:MAG: glycosyltransferase family 2 protein [Eubacteriales bacterium]
MLSFSRNFGHQLAVTCGMDAAKGDAQIIIDVDLQDPPELIPEMVRMWEAGADIVYGKRVKRKGETIFKKITASMYYRLLSWMSAYPIPLDTGDFRLIGRNVADVFLQMREHNRFLRGMSAWMELQRGSHRIRAAGAFRGSDEIHAQEDAAPRKRRHYGIFG